MLRHIKYQVLFHCGYYFTGCLSFGFFKCDLSFCKLCPKALNSSFVFDNDFNQFRILYFLNCSSNCIIFSVYCNRCGPISVMYTRHSLRSAYQNIINTVYCKPLTLLSSHFNLPDHSIDNLFLQGLDFCFKQDFHCKIFFWVKRLKTFQYPGIDSTIHFPFSIRFGLPFTNSNYILFNKVKSVVIEKFNVKLKPGFSCHPNFKKILCKSKFN